VLGAIKDEHLARHGLGRDQIRVLRHVSRAVDLARVVDPLHDVDPRLARRQRVPAQLAPFVVVRAAVEHVRAGTPGARGDLHGRDLEVVRCLAGGVRSEQQAVRRVGFIWGPERAAWRAHVCISPVVDRGEPRHSEMGQRKKRRTILCPGTIDRLNSASQAHALSSDHTGMGHSSS